MDKETLASLSNYDFATDVYCKLMHAKCDLGADHFDLAEVIAHLKFIASTDQHPKARAMYADILATDALAAE